MSDTKPRTAPLTDELELAENARRVLEARYLKKDESGRCTERAEDLLRRVSKTVADIEVQYGANDLTRQRWENRFYRMMATWRFMPNSPTLMNAGREMGMLSACFVLPVRDSIPEIFNSVKHTAYIQKAGGGTGFAFDELRPTGDYIQSSGGTTSGPISFWRVFSEATNAIQQGAFRRGANMGMMYVHHPDILKFLHAKQDLNAFTNYNISVKVTDTWMDEFMDDPDSPHIVRNPRTGMAYVIPRELDIWKYDVRDLITVDCVEPVAPSGRESYYRTPRMIAPLPKELAGKVYTKREIWEQIVHNAWQTGEPGVVFIDCINAHNPTPHLGRIEATNPCGEQPLLPYEACNLGSLNLGAFVRNGHTPDAQVDWDALREEVHVATRFLDNVIDANNYPLPEIERVCRGNRKIGLGIMGFADALYMLGVPYNSDEGIEWGRRLMKFVNDEAHACSEQLARERGCFEHWQGSVWHTRHNRLMRNAAVTTVAPTGTISIIANCSGGIEPLFSLAFLRNVLRGQNKGNRPLVQVNQAFLRIAKERGFHSEELIERIAREGTLAHIDEIPDDVKRVFVCAHDIDPDWHIRMQAAFQEHCDSSISKTINFPESATKQDVDELYRQAYRLGCKGVTVYRDNCRAHQPMALKQSKEKPPAPTAEPKKKSGNGGEAQRPAMDRLVTDQVTQQQVPTVAETSTARPYIEPVDLPEIVSGFRIRQMTPFGNMHVKITVDPRNDRELEIFAQLGKGGDVANSDLEGLCRLASLLLRSGLSMRHIVKQLEGIGSSMQIPTRMGRITSLPDGLACALKKYARAKERFGLRAMLLGEITPDDIENPPPPALHAARDTAGDRTVDQKTGRSSGGSTPAGETSSVPVTKTERWAGTTVRQATSGSEPTAPGSTTPRAKYVSGGNGKGNGHGPSKPNGNGHNGNSRRHPVQGQPRVNLTESTGVSVNVATLTVEETETQVAVAEPPTAPSANAEPRSMSATEKRTRCALDLNSVLSSVRHHHDAGSYYKFICPECGEALRLQEGCRHCPNCHWAAC